MDAIDFTSDIHSPIKYMDLYFEDGNIAVVAGMSYFLVHRGLLSRHSEVLGQLMHAMDSSQILEGRPVLTLPDPSIDIAHLLKAIYDGISFLAYDAQGFPTLSALLRTLTKYQAHHLRNDILRELSMSWPTSLAQWDVRETSVIRKDGTITPSKSLPHPIEIIRLAREIDYLPILPSAMYDLSRITPRQAAIGIESPVTGKPIGLEHADLLRLLKGREQASNFFSAFIVAELEGRKPSRWCLRREDAANKRTCQAAFTTITFELLQDTDSITKDMFSDPLYAISKAGQMQLCDVGFGSKFPPTTPCKACWTVFAMAVGDARENFWGLLPEWFDIDVSTWG